MGSRTETTRDLTLHIWRQKGPNVPGEFRSYNVTGVSPDISFIEMLDMLNADLVAKNEEPIAFDCDCLEGICGSCSLMIDGVPHGPESGTTTCQLFMRSFKNGAQIYVEPWRAKPFPIIKDLVVDRNAFDRIIQAGGFVSVNVGSAPEANSILVPKQEADTAMDAAQCIGCGACVAGCKNGSAMLFVAAAVGKLSHLPQGEPEKHRRVLRMVEQMDREGFGACTNTYECEAVCPKEISVRFIAELNKHYIRASALQIPE